MEGWKGEGKGGVEWMAKMGDCVKFWDSMVVFLQQCAVRNLHARGEYVDFLGDMNSDTVDLFLMDPASIEIFIKVLPDVFSVKITLFSPQFAFLKKSYLVEAEAQKLAVLYLFRDGGLYHVLYSQAQLDVEEYSVQELKVVSGGDRGVQDLSSLYFTTKARKKITSSIAQDIELSQKSSSNLTLFCSVAQDYISALQRVISARKKTEFYTPELTKGTLLMMQEYNSNLERLSEFSQKSDEFSNVLIGKLKDGALQQAFRTEEIFKQVNACDFCQKESASVILECSHAICSKHIIEHVNQAFQSNPLLLKANGDTTEDFRCPLLSCFVRISGQKYREIIGPDSFNRHLTDVESVTRTKCCWHCQRIRPLDAFQPLCECGKSICVYCYCDFYRRNDGFCSCGAKITGATVEHLKTLTGTCAGCHSVKSFLSDFSHLECDGHTLCQECLVSVAKSTKRCLFCYRHFTPREISEAQSLFQKQCQFCNRECSRTRLNTPCGCIVCLSCARQLTVSRGQCTHCFVCSSVLSQQGYNQLFVFLPEETKEPEIVVFQCAVCLMDIGAEDRLVLPCEDILHKDCFEEYVSNKVQDGYSDMTVNCPMEHCRKPFQMGYIQSVVSPQLYGKLYDNVIRGKSTKCPNCQTMVYDRDEYDTKKGNVMCLACRFTFCTECGGEYRPDHDQVKCKYLQVQAVVKLAEVSASKTDTVAQCPSCKYPFIHTSGCPNVTCRTQGCGIKFCVLCSTPFFLYQSHGSAWHRPCCEKYNSSDRRGNRVNLNCRECVTQKRLCRQPRDLKVRRRFALDEY